MYVTSWIKENCRAVTATIFLLQEIWSGCLQSLLACDGFTVVGAPGKWGSPACVLYVPAHLRGKITVLREATLDLGRAWADVVDEPQWRGTNNACAMTIQCDDEVITFCSGHIPFGCDKQGFVVPRLNQWLHDRVGAGHYLVVGLDKSTYSVDLSCLNADEAIVAALPKLIDFCGRGEWQTSLLPRGFCRYPSVPTDYTRSDHAEIACALLIARHCKLMRDQGPSEKGEGCSYL